MAGIITYPWARPHGYNPKLKLKKEKNKQQQASNKLDSQSQR